MTAASQSGRCVITVTAGSGGSFEGHPLMFGVDTATNNCAVTESTIELPTLDGGGADASVSPGDDAGPHNDAGTEPGRDVATGPSSDGGTNADGGTPPAPSGCACTVTPGRAPRDTRLASLVVGLCAALAVRRRHRIVEQRLAP